MDDRPKRVSDTERSILEVLWRADASTASDIAAELYPEPGKGRSKAATVHSLLERLEKKGWVERDRSTYPHSFRAVLTRDRYVASELERVAEQVCDGSLTPLLLSLAGRAKLSAEERERIQALLDRPDGTERGEADRDGEPSR